jgi:microcystin-dependent protein
VSAELITYRGAYETAKGYLSGDVVFDSSNPTQFYIAVEDFTSVSLVADIAASSLYSFFDLGDVFTRLTFEDVTISSGWEFSEDDRLIPYAATELVTVSTDPDQGIKNNYEAVLAPTVNDDEGEDYTVGSMWIDTATNNIYTCTDPTETAAVWKKISNETIAPTSSIPSGMLAYFPIGTVPTGWLACDGTAYLKASYADLYTALKDGGATCIYGEDTTTFNVPDARGQFIRTYDGTAGVDPDKATRTDRGDGTIGNYVGTKQAGGFLKHDHGGEIESTSTGSHTHSGSTSSAGSHTHTASFPYYKTAGATAYMVDRRDSVDTGDAHTQSVTVASGGAHTHTFTTGTGGAHTHLTTVEEEGGNETRPVNISFQLCIKY